MTSEQASQRAENLQKRNANSFLLAQVLSFAALAEPALIRMIRLELLPNSRTADEADLWFSNLVQSQSPDGIVFYSEVAEILRRGLPQNLREKAWYWTKERHGGIPRAIQIEEELTYLSLNPEANQERIDELLGDVISTMVSGRKELANWASRALPRLPSAIQTRETSAALKIASDYRMGRTLDLRGALAPLQRMPAWLELVLPQLPRVRVSVSLTNHELTLGPVFSDLKESLPHSIEVPDTPTIAVEARWQASDGTASSRILFVDKEGMSQPEAVGEGPIELITLANETWTVQPTGKQAGLSQVGPPAIVAYTDGYAVTLHWRLRDSIPNCLGFALLRRRRNEQTGVPPESHEVLPSHIGVGASGKSALSSRRPIQHFSWIDQPPLRDIEYSYQVIPVVGNLDKLEMIEPLASAWTSWIRVGAQQDAAISVTFNRTLEKNDESFGPTPKSFLDLARLGIEEVISQPNHQIRQALGGDLLSSLKQLLMQAVERSYRVYVTMEELTDPEMLAYLERLRGRANVVLAGKSPDSHMNEKAQHRLRQTGAQIYEWSVPLRIQHNKFMVVCDSNDTPLSVWLGNVDWSSASFCRQANAAVIVNNPQVANTYFDHWKRLTNTDHQPFKVEHPPPTVSVIEATVQPWLTPVQNSADLQAVGRYIQDARQGILFLLGDLDMPRSVHLTSSLLQTIVEQEHIYILGILDDGQDFRFHVNKRSWGGRPKSGIPPPWFLQKRMRIQFQTRMIVIDPLGSRPVLIIGSRNLGKASSTDTGESFLIIENDREVARRCATHVHACYDYYSSLTDGLTKNEASRLEPTDEWQKPYFEGILQSQLPFWLGEDTRSIEPQPDSQQAVAPKQAPRKKVAQKPIKTRKTSEPASMKETERSSRSLGEEVMKAVSNIQTLIIKTKHKDERTQLTRQQMRIRDQAKLLINQFLDESWPEYAEATEALKSANAEAETAKNKHDKIASSIKKFATAIDKLELLEVVTSGKVPGVKAALKQIKPQKTSELAATKKMAGSSRGYLIVHFPRSRRVLIDDEFNGRTEELIELESGRHTVSLGPPYGNYKPDQYTIIVKDTSEFEPREVTFEVIAVSSSDERNEGKLLRKNIARKMIKK